MSHGSGSTATRFGSMVLGGYVRVLLNLGLRRTDRWFQHDYRLLSFDFRVISHILTSPVYEKPWQTRQLLSRLIGRGRAYKPVW
jgi:hypothetical protein